MKKGLVQTIDLETGTLTPWPAPPGAWVADSFFGFYESTLVRWTLDNGQTSSYVAGPFLSLKEGFYYISAASDLDLRRARQFDPIHPGVGTNGNRSHGQPGADVSPR